MILLNFRDNFRHFPPLGKVDQVRVVQKVGVPLLEEKDVGLVLPEEGDTGWVDGAELLQVQFVVVGHEAGGVLQRLQQVRLELLLEGCVSELAKIMRYSKYLALKTRQATTFYQAAHPKLRSYT